MCPKADENMTGINKVYIVGDDGYADDLRFLAMNIPENEREQIGKLMHDAILDIIKHDDTVSV